MGTPTGSLTLVEPGLELRPGLLVFVFSAERVISATMKRDLIADWWPAEGWNVGLGIGTGIEIDTFELCPAAEALRGDGDAPLDRS